MAATGLVLDDRFRRHDTGPGHPERPQRLSAIEEALTQRGLTPRCTLIAPRPADLARVHTIHTPAYVQRLEQHCRDGETRIDCLDSRICPASYETALLACGAVLCAAEGVADGELDNAFCAVRPPGHHAESDRSMGFCLFNNIAVTARVLLERDDIKRIFILDWDVHHGNGTQHAFEEDPRVFFCSLHGHPATLYPGSGYPNETGRGRGRGTTLNITMMPGAGDEAYHRAFDRQVLPAARAYQPDFILVSAGFDAHGADPLALIDLQTDSFAWMTREVLALAKELCAGRVLSTLEGGYHLPALGESVAAHVDALLNT